MRPLMIASLGNPGRQYAVTRHSVGHVVTAAMQQLLSAPPLMQDATYKGAACSIDGVMLWQSPSYMNLSGVALDSAWKKFSVSSKLDDPGFQPHLIILHDELELDIGRVSIKSGAGKSSRGHNGLKSVLSKPNLAKLDFTRVGVGIGPRPDSRDPKTVADFVLRELNIRQIKTVEALAEPIWDACDLIRKGKRAPSTVRARQDLGSSPKKG